MNKRVLILILVILLLLAGGAGVYLYLQSTKPPANQKVVLTYWGLWDEPAVYEELFQEYTSKNPNVEVQYSKKILGKDLNSKYSYRGIYQTTVDERLKEGDVDIMRVHQTWISRLQSNLAPAPQNLFTERVVKQDYYPAVYDAITSTKGEIFGAPMTIDGLVLFYNKDLLTAAGVTTPPKNWDEAIATAKKLTITQNGEIRQAGINMGTASNSLHGYEIALLMMTQADVQVVTPSISGTKATFATNEAAGALTSYFSYARTHKVWSGKLPTDLDLFSEGKLAMMIAPSWRASDIVNANSKINFDTAPVPVLPGANRDTPQYLASYWIDVVSKKSPNSAEAWKLLAWMSEPDQLRKIYNAQKKQRLFGNPYPRTSMKNELADAPYAKTILEMAPGMKSWPLQNYGVWEDTITKHLIQLEIKPTAITAGDIEEAQKEINTLVFPTSSQ